MLYNTSFNPDARNNGARRLTLRWADERVTMDNDGSNFWRRQGDHFASDPGQWEFQARMLLGGANVCWERYSTAAESVRAGRTEPTSDLWLLIPAHFLAAVGTELLLKAIALKRCPDLATTGGKSFYTHKLAEVATQFTGIEFSESELQLFERLGATIEWAGRYPVPRWDNEKHRKKYDVPTRLVNGNVVIDARDVHGSVSEESWRATTFLINKLQCAYHETTRAGAM